MKIYFLLLIISLSRSTWADWRDPRIENALEYSRDNYNTKEKIIRRRKNIAESFLRELNLYPFPKKTQIKTTRHSYRTLNGYTVENIGLEIFPGFFATGNLYKPTLDPKHMNKKMPGVLVAQGYFLDGRFNPNQQILSAELAKMGAIVFSYSLVGWNDSRQVNHEIKIALGLQLLTSIRVLDFLTELKNIDISRIAVTGASSGGIQSLYLALVDERIKALAPVVSVYNWSYFSNHICICEGSNHGIPVMKPTETNAVEISAVLAPMPQMIVSVGYEKVGHKNPDETADFPYKDFPFVQSFYKIFTKKNNLENVHFSKEAHDYGNSKRLVVYDFFKKHLGLSGGSKYPAKVKIESVQDLEVFNKTHPLPAHALRGEKSVIKAYRDLQFK